jgi:hypothetical protein
MTVEKDVDKGACLVLVASDVGLSINLDEAERRIAALKQRGSIKHKHRAPHYFEFRPAPLRVSQEAEPLDLGAHHSSPSVEVVLYDFGGAFVVYTIPLQGPFSRLLELSETLHENPRLLADSRDRVEHLLTAIKGTVEKAHISDYVEDYAVFHVEAISPPMDADVFCTAHSLEIAQILRSERRLLSEQESKDATSVRISFGADDATIIDWYAALVFGRDMEDVRAVLEFATVELLEMRFLDHQLDDALDQAYDALSKRMESRLRWPGSFEADLRRIARLQVDGAVLFERVTNALKLLGDQYLARVYRLASQRFHLAEWDAGIMRKLQTLDSIYGKMADRAATRRMELLEWIIIVLITVSIVVSFLPGFTGH